MQAMMIQDISAGPKNRADSVVHGPREHSEESFGKALRVETGRSAKQADNDRGAETARQDRATKQAGNERAAGQASQDRAAKQTGNERASGQASQDRAMKQSDNDRTAEHVENQQADKSMAVDSVENAQLKEQDAEATPFFMAALINQSASFVKPSENSDLIAAAERTQELIGDWLKPQQEGEELLEEIVVAALAALEQSTETPPPLAAAGTELQPAVLSDDEVAELRDLLAMMVQGGQLPEPLQGHPLVAELQKQLDLVQPLVAPTGGKRGELQAVPLATQSSSINLAGEVDSGALSTGGAVQPEVAAGLQESQIARILASRQDQPAGRVQGGLEKQGEPAPMMAGDVETSDEFSLETVKAAVQSIAGEIQPQQSSQAASLAHRMTPQGEIVAPKLMQLPSGQQLTESHLVDQVVTHLAGSVDGASGRISLRLQPAELGSVRLDLIVDGDRLRAHLQAQTQQVQEVLDRHLPQLKEALQQQGLKIDEFRVDVQSDQDRASEQGFAWQQQEHQGHSAQSPWLADDWQQPEMAIPLQQLLQQQGGGISLRV